MMISWPLYGNRRVSSIVISNEYTNRTSSANIHISENPVAEGALAIVIVISLEATSYVAAWSLNELL